MAGDWRRVRLSDLGPIVTGRTPPGTLPEFFGGTVPFVTPTDMDGRRKIGETARTLSTQGIETLRKVIVPRGVSVSCIGWQMGKAVLIDRPAATNQQINTLIPSIDLADDLFVYYALTQQRDAIFRLGAGGSRTPILNKSGFQAFEIAIPPLAEQKAIAAVLGALDDKIELNRRMNATLEAMARALFKSWFVDFDPVRAKLDGRQPPGLDQPTADLFPAAFEDSPLGPVPKGWRAQKLGDLCKLGRGSSPRPIHDYMNGEVPWIKIADATSAGGPFLFETKERVTLAGAEKSEPVVPGDLILSNSATCGVPIFVELHGCIHDGWLYFKDLRSVSKLYLFRVLIELAEHLVHIADGSVQKNLNINLVGDQLVLVPPTGIMAEFDRHAAAWFDKMRENVRESRTLAALRDALLPRLLSGELRVPEAMKQTEAALAR